MPLSRRYTPAWFPGEAALVGMDFSFVIPPGVGIQSGTLHFYQNIAVPVIADTDFDIGTVFALGRALYATLAGGTEGRDYQVRWQATDTDGYVWPRAALMLCALTS